MISQPLTIYLRSLRLGIFIGFASFFFMEKTLRVLSGDDEPHSHSHSHSHSHAPREVTAESTAINTASQSQDGVRKRRSSLSDANGKSEGPEDSKPTAGPSKLSAYLNLFGDFVHNM